MERTPPIVTPFGPLKTPTGATIIRFPRHRTFVHLAAERRGSDRPYEPQRVANDRFEPEWEPLAWVDDEPATGGRLGLLIMLGVAVLIGVLLATGGVL